jgi:hypothetical protein
VEGEFTIQCYNKNGFSISGHQYDRYKVRCI